MKQSDFQAKVILASRPIQGGPDLITVQCRYPRIIHAEVLTHRVFSRNARSSRAVPTKKLLGEDIYIPHFMKNQAGMQSFEEFLPDELEEIQEKWLEFAKETQRFQEWLVEKNVHKQWSNRPGEWFGYIDVLITSTEWNNWFDLRDHSAAMPEIRNLAQTMDREFHRILVEKEMQTLQVGEWHIPYSNFHMIKPLDIELKLSVARCARVSYQAFDGNTTTANDLRLHDQLRNANPIHASPFEHQAQVCGHPSNVDPEYIQSNFAHPWLQYRKVIGE